MYYTRILDYCVTWNILFQRSQCQSLEVRLGKSISYVLFYEIMIYFITIQVCDPGHRVTVSQHVRVHIRSCVSGSLPEVCATPVAPLVQAVGVSLGIVLYP